MNLDAYDRTWRKRLDGAGLVRLLSVDGPLVSVDEEPIEDPTLADAIAPLAEAFESIPPEELAGIVQDASQVAGDLDEPPELRRLGAALGALCEGVLQTALADWDDLLVLMAARGEVILKGNDDDG